ncbi:MAG: ABC transporter ATP-binding protein [Ferruginibacter sp.]
MTDTIIKVENLGKSYLIGHERTQGYVALRDVLAQKTKGAFRGVKNMLTGNQLISGTDIEEFWALKDINFEIKKGDAVGIIGRNGAGKSTLLKILSRITDPTTGRIELDGRVASLLEVGTGFHPELSGRENIFLNGAILGMSRSEIKSKFDEIVDFSGIEKFLDTPVKRYSSGMYVRLAFAVAAHLEPEILVVDEVLAVGDADFQKKCLGKMDDVAKKEGRTVLFVSHNMGAIESLCSTAILLENGKLKYTGDVKETIRNYFVASNVQRRNWKVEENGGKKYENSFFSITAVSLVDRSLNNKDNNIFSAEDKVGILIEGTIQQPDKRLEVGFIVSEKSSGQIIFWSHFNDKPESEWIKLEKGYNKFIGWIPDHFLNENDYVVEVVAYIYQTLAILNAGVNAPQLEFTIKGGLSNSPYWYSARRGNMAPILNYERL